MICLRVFRCPTYYHVKEDKLGPRARKRVFVGFKKGVKGYKILDLKDKKFILSRAVTFDEASMMKPKNSQQVKSQTTDMISQQVESDATLPSLERSISFEIIPAVTQSGDHEVDQDVAAADEDQGHVMLARRPITPITLVLMMINSFSYSTNDLVFN